MGTFVTVFTRRRDRKAETARKKARIRAGWRTPRGDAVVIASRAFRLRDNEGSKRSHRPIAVAENLRDQTRRRAASSRERDFRTLEPEWNTINKATPWQPHTYMRARCIFNYGMHAPAGERAGLQLAPRQVEMSVSSARRRHSTASTSCQENDVGKGLSSEK